MPHTRLPSLIINMASVLLLSLLWVLPTPVLGFGTVDSDDVLGQQSEHERITRAALHCTGDVISAECFSPESLDFLGGDDFTFGAVGNPDNVFDWPSGLGEPSEAHCDDADFLDIAGYPQSREQATAALLRCVSHIHDRLQQGLDAAAEILGADGYIDPDKAKIPLTGCSTNSGIQSSTAKCTALLGFGRALHGVQDFYSHSNWADHADPNVSISVTNPPGLGYPFLADFLDSRFIGPPHIPHNLTTGCFAGFTSDETVGEGVCTGRVTHHALNKDGGVVDPNTFGGTGPSDPSKGPRDTTANFHLAVIAAEKETRRQWRTFRDALIDTHGDVKGSRIICALTRDDPIEDCNGRKIGIVVDSSGSNQDTDPSNLRISAATQINAQLITADQAAANPNAKPDLVTVVDFDDVASVIYPLGDPSGADFSSIDSNGGTYIAGGIAAAIDEITADTKYKTRGRSGIIVLTDGDDSAVAARLTQLARAWASGIKVSFGFLAPIAIPVATPRRRGKDHPSTGLLSRQSSSDDVLVAILKTGGLYATIDSADAQLAFVDLVLANGITDANDGRSATALAKGLGVLGLVEDETTARYFSYHVSAGEDVTINLGARSSQCEFNATLTAVDVGALVANTSFSSATSGVANELHYTASASGILELEVTASGPATGDNGTIECVFAVQLAGVYVPPPSSTVESASSSTTPAASSTPSSNTTTTSTPTGTWSTGEPGDSTVTVVYVLP